MIGLTDGNGRTALVSGLTPCVVLPSGFEYFFNPVVENGYAIFDRGQPYARRCEAQETTVGQVADGTAVLVEQGGRWTWRTITRVSDVSVTRFDLIEMTALVARDEYDARRQRRAANDGSDDSEEELSLTAWRARLLEVG
jgi:hypothetical protein